MKKMVKRLLAAVIVAVMVFGSAPLGGLVDFVNLYNVNASAAGVEYCMFPVQSNNGNSYIRYKSTNVYFGDGTRDKKNSHHNIGYAFDFDYSDGKICAPFSGTIYVGIDNSTHSVVLVSDGPVLLANGTIVKRAIAWFAHDNYLNKNVFDGAHVNQGEYFYDQGGYGKGIRGYYGTHVHIEFAGFSDESQFINNYRDYEKTGAAFTKYGYQPDDAFFVTKDYYYNCYAENANQLHKYKLRIAYLDPDNCMATETLCYFQAKATSSSFYLKRTPHSTFDGGTNNASERPITKGQTLTIYGKVKNSSGNLWYRTEWDGISGYVYSEHIAKVKDLPQLEFKPNYPKGNLQGRNHKKGDSFAVKGVINSYTKKIVSVEGKIVKCNSLWPLDFSVSCTSGKKNPNAFSYEINAFDSSMKFKSLDVGLYAFILYAQVEGGKNKIIHFDVFRVVTSSSAIPKDTQPKVFAEKLANTPDANQDIKDNEKPNQLVSAGSITTAPPAPPSSPAQPTYYNYKIGIYRTTSSDSLNVRTGPGSNYSKATSAIPKGTEIAVKEINSNAWGKVDYNGVSGWVCLAYTTYLRAFAGIGTPEAPAIKLTSISNIAVGTSASASWNAVNYADTYTAYLKDNSGNVVKTLSDITGTSAYFIVDAAGKYTITVRGVNSQHLGNESAASAAFVAHSPYTVSFVDWNGRTETRTAAYGEKVTAPDPPQREGYTFMGWDKSFDSIVTDTVVNATYKIKSYTVKFVKVENGKTIVLKSEKVDYGNEATPPADTQAANGYIFVDWNTKDYKCVEQNLSVQAVYQWENPDLPVSINGLTATRINGGYNISFLITCADQNVTLGRVITSMKTAEGKQIVTTESAAFSLAIGTINKTMEIFVPSDNPATVAEVYVVESFGKAIPQSNVKTCSINMNNSWSSWSTQAPVSNTYDDLESRTEYSYRTKSTTTASSRTLSGWTIYNTTTSRSSGSSYSWVGSYNSDAHVRTVSTATEYTYATWYRYHHYTNGGYNCDTGKNVKWACSPWVNNRDDGFGPTNYGPHYIETPSPLSAQTSTTWNIPKYNSSCSAYVPVSNCTCINTWFYNQTPFQKVVGSKTRYDYTDTYYTYYFYKWSDWSAYSPNVATASSTKEVKTRTVYRFKNQELGVEDTSGILRLASTQDFGLTIHDIKLPLLADHAGDQVTLYIYKYNEASDWTGEFIGQTTVANDGSYSFEFKLREEPTSETGDFIASIGIEGCDNIINVGKIIAPKEEYKVIFRYADPSDNESEYVTAQEQMVTEGSGVVAPANPEFEGYKFLGWDTNLSYVSDECMFVEYGQETGEKIITFTAKYEPKEFVVTFIDWDTDSFIMKRCEYGDHLAAPTLSADEGYEAVWKDVDLENTVVTGDMVITAQRTKKIYEVNFYDYDGNVIDTQSLEYGATASDVNLPEKEGYVFVDWEYDDCYIEALGDDGETPVLTDEKSVKFYPKYVFDKSVESPVSSLADGVYDNSQTIELSTPTENAVIYYTLDGSDPKDDVSDAESAPIVMEYTGPITLSQSAVLKYYACAFEHNDSEVMTNYYAINAGVTTSDWMLEADVPEYVMENIDDYDMQQANGHRYKDVAVSSNYNDILNYESLGWTNEGFEYGAWSEWTLSAPTLDGIAYESETQEPGTEEEARYQYTRYKYVDTVSGDYAYSATELDGIVCELETLLLESKLEVAGYTSGITKYYTYNSERWFNQTLVSVEVVPDYLLYRYRLKNYTLTKWSDWTNATPAADETRERQDATIFKYSIPEMCIVTIDPGLSTFANQKTNYIVEVNEYLTVDESEFIFEGYDFLGFFTDSSFTNYFNYETQTISSSITLYPKYSAHTFDVMFVDFDGTVLSEETVEYGDYAVGPDLNDRDGYVFIGWDSQANEFVTEDLIMTATYVTEEEYCTVSLDHDAYHMMVGNSLQLNATVTPADAENLNAAWYSSDNLIAVVNDEGNVTAFAEGEVIITVECEATGFTDECVITVVSNPSEVLCINPDSTLTLDSDNSLLRGLRNSVWTVDALKEEFMNNSEDLTATDISGNLLTGSSLVGTGTIIRFIDNETVKDEVTVVVTGDMTGDGVVNNRDSAMISRYLVDKETADFAQMCAIDVNGDGYVNNRDASMVSRYLVGKETI